MSRMLDAWHDRYHGEYPDYEGCPYCQDDLMGDQEFHSASEHPETLPLPVVEIDAETEWGAWLEATYDPDNERLEDLEI